MLCQTLVTNLGRLDLNSGIIEESEVCSLECHEVLQTVSACSCCNASKQ